MRPTLTTPRLTLRPLAAGWDLFVERVLVPRSEPSPRDCEQGLTELIEIWLPQQPDPALERLGLGSWIGYEDGTFVGWFHLTPGEGDTAVLGYRLRRRCWGRGLATEGAAALVEYAFESAGVRAVVAETVVANERSHAVLRKLGMHEQRTLPEQHAAYGHGEGPRSESCGALWSWLRLDHR
jgi:RimJ/RimL family protein N-acetyltransferase